MNELFDQSDLTDRAASLVEAAGRHGADAADAISVRGISMSVETRNGKIEETGRAENDDFTLRVFVGTRSASVSANVLSDIDELAGRAVAMARAAPEDAYAGLADADRLTAEVAALDLVDETMPSTDTLAEDARAADEAALAVPGITRSGGASAGWSLSGLVLATSTGFSGAYLRSRHSVSVAAIAGEGTAMERDYEYDYRVFRADLRPPADIGREAGRRAVKRLNPRKLPSGTLPVVYDPRVAGGLVGHLAGAIGGAAVARGTSFLRERLGEALFRPQVSVTDDPHKPRGLGSRPFDGEGVAGERLDLVAGGKLTSWLLDSAAARELGLATNGRAARGGGVPTPGATNLWLHPGAASPQDLVGGIDNGFFVTELIGQGVNLVTGDYSRGAAGFAIENGELAFPVSEVTVASNLTHMFQVLEPADDLDDRRRIAAPTVMVDAMALAGA